MMKSYTEPLLKISKFISTVFNPINSLLFYFVIYSLKNSSLKESLQNFLPIFLITILPISGWILWNVKKKRYSDSDVSNRKQRKSLYFFIGGAISIYLLFIYLKFERIDWVLFFLLVLLLLMQISNYLIKSSMHTAINIFVAALFFTISPLIGIFWLGVSVVVAISRIILKRHSPAEVFAGSFIGISVSFIYLYTHIQTAI
ncbi:phosphatase PAP2 family protein [Chryseobacterium sp. SNU WT5]|uniref:phosphatase PAP2 family protein n=1 Tax=Chryseobacterium sp. SNU WT5 TaxID=2594269 RepID=UPI00117F7878|nr:phosphatase PAP2 family protein [Chryseobacterium sp. SNU WT5]QDP84083.1 phosphatase PAP2 family protein [Chryseobacterium sp. SNU WT5]